MYYYHLFRNDFSQDINELLQLITEVVRLEAITELTFDYLKVISPSEEKELLLDLMLEEERSHFEELKKIYFMLTGQQPIVDPPTFERPDTYIGGIIEIFNQKVDTLSIYKKLKLISPYQTIREKVTDFIQDELQHLSMLNHILIKSKLDFKENTFVTAEKSVREFFS